MYILKRVVPLVLVLIILAAGVGYLLSTERQESGNMTELYQQTEPLQRQKDELQAQKEELSKSFKVVTRDVSTVQILFRETHTNLFTKAYPLMRDRGITGVVGMCIEDYPGCGIRNKMSLDEYNRLIMDGWGSCLVYDGKYQLENFLMYMADRLNNKNIMLPNAIYFSDSSRVAYDPTTMDPILEKYGIDVVINNTTDARSEMVTEVGDIWQTGAMPWNYTGVGSDLELLATTEGGNLTLTATYDDIWDGIIVQNVVVNYNKPTEPQVQEAFIAFLDIIQAMLEKTGSLLTVTPTPSPTPTPGPNGEEQIEPILRTTDYSTARDTHLKAQHSIEQQLFEYEKMQADIDAQIAELETKIAEIYAAYNIKYTTTGNKSGGTA